MPHHWLLLVVLPTVSLPSVVVVVVVVPGALARAAGADGREVSAG